MATSRLAELIDDAIGALEDDGRLDRGADRVHDLARRVADSPIGPELRGRTIGHTLHPLMTDLPVGFWTSAAVLDAIGGSSGRAASRRLVGFGVLTALPTALTGLAELAAVDRSDRSTLRVATVHAGLNTMALLSYARSWMARRRGRQARGVGWSIVGAVAASASGHLGGHLVFVLGVGDGHRGADQGGDGLRAVPDLGTDLLAHASDATVEPAGSADSTD